MSLYLIMRLLVAKGLSKDMRSISLILQTYIQMKLLVKQAKLFLQVYSPDQGKQSDRVKNIFVVVRQKYLLKAKV